MKILATMIVTFIAISTFVFSSYAIDEKIIVGIWLFDENEGNVVEDASGNGHEGEIMGNVEWVEGKFGPALEFGKGDSYVLIPHDDSLNLKTFSITAWVNLVNLGAYAGIVEKFDEGDIRSFYLDVNPDGKLYGGFKGENGWNSCMAEKVTDEKWHHVAVTYDMKKLLVYIDGDSSSGEMSLGEEGIEPLLNTAPVYIGGPATGGGGPNQGIIDEVGIFNDALTEADVNDIMKNGFEQSVLAVESSGKLAVTWGSIKEF